MPFGHVWVYGFSEYSGFKGLSCLNLRDQKCGLEGKICVGLQPVPAFKAHNPL